MKKMILVFVVAFSVTFLLAGLIVPLFGKPSQKLIKQERVEKLCEWRQQVMSFLVEQHRLPDSLYEVFLYLERVQGREPQYRMSLYADDVTPKEFENMHDPNKFDGIVEYALFAGTRGWYIKETGHDPMYPKNFMIDHNGMVYEIKEVKTLGIKK